MENKDNDLYPLMKENIDPGIEKPKEHKNGCLGCGGDLKADV